VSLEACWHVLDYSVAIEAFLSLFDHHETDQVPDLKGVLFGEGLGLVVWWTM